MTAITIGIIALVVSILNAAAGIANFVLSRFRLIRVQEIRSYLSGESRYFAVDIVSYGSAIWDMEVEIEIYMPPTAQGVLAGAVGTVSIPLQVLGKCLNPLNPGQGMRFEASIPENASPDRHAIPKSVAEMLPSLSRWPKVFSQMPKPVVS